MPDDSNNNYTLPPGYEAVTGQTIQASQHNPPLEDIAAAMTRRLGRNGAAPMLGNLDMGGFKLINGGAASNDGDFVTLAQLNAAIAAIAAVPTGKADFWPISSTTAPPGWIFMRGQTLSRTTYANLWAAIQAGDNLAATEEAKLDGQFGPGDGSTTFTLPDPRDYFIRVMAAAGRAIGSEQTDAFKSHAHTAVVHDPGHDHDVNARVATTGPGLDTGGNFVPNLPTSTGSATTGITVTINNTGDTETRPKNLAWPLIIKT